MVHSTLYKKSHNAVVQRIKRAVMGMWCTVSDDRAVGSAILRPDLVLKKNRDLLILDVTVPFENGLEAFAVVRRTEGREI